METLTLLTPLVVILLIPSNGQNSIISEILIIFNIVRLYTLQAQQRRVLLFIIAL